MVNYSIHCRAKGADRDGQIAVGEALPPRENEHRTSDAPLHFGNVSSDLVHPQHPTLLTAGGNRVIHHGGHSRVLCVHHQQVSQMDSSCEAKARGNQG